MSCWVGLGVCRMNYSVGVSDATIGAQAPVSWLPTAAGVAMIPATSSRWLVHEEGSVFVIRDFCCAADNRYALWPVGPSAFGVPKTFPGENSVLASFSMWSIREEAGALVFATSQASTRFVFYPGTTMDFGGGLDVGAPWWRGGQPVYTFYRGIRWVIQDEGGVLVFRDTKSPGNCRIALYPTPGTPNLDPVAGLPMTSDALQATVGLDTVPRRFTVHVQACNVAGCTIARGTSAVLFDYSAPVLANLAIAGVVVTTQAFVGSATLVCTSRFLYSYADVSAISIRVVGPSGALSSAPVPVSATGASDDRQCVPISPPLTDGTPYHLSVSALSPCSSLPMVLVGFDDLGVPSAGCDGASLPAPYYGLVWTRVSYLTQASCPPNQPRPAPTSGTNYAIISSNGGTGTMRIAGGVSGTFGVTSMQLRSLGPDSQVVSILGRRGSAVVAAVNATVGTATWLLMSLPSAFATLDGLDFVFPSTSAGTVLVDSVALDTSRLVVTSAPAQALGMSGWNGVFYVDTKPPVAGNVSFVTGGQAGTASNSTTTTLAVTWTPFTGKHCAPPLID
jgi:hypothetical protein